MRRPGAPASRPRADDRPEASALPQPGEARAAGSPDLAAFLAEGARRRSLHSRQEPGRPEFWAEPDPAAIGLAGLGHPVDRALARRKAGESRDTFAGLMRRACERLLDLQDPTGRGGRRLTDEELRAYPWHHLDLDLAAAYHESVDASFSRQSTRNEAVGAVRAVVTECYRAGLISALRRDRLLEELYTVSPGPSSKRRRLSQPEITRLLAACESMSTPQAQARNTAIVALFRTSGMRVGELVRLQLCDYDRAEGTLWLRDTKNGRDHLVFLHPDAVAYLARWLTFRGDEPGAVFTAMNRADARALHPASVRYMLRTRAEAAGVAPFGSHDFRRTFATELLRTHDIALVGKLLNHNKTASTVIYDLAGEQEQREAVARIELPVLADDVLPDSGTVEPGEVA